MSTPAPIAKFKNVQCLTVHFTNLRGVMGELVWPVHHYLPLAGHCLPCQGWIQGCDCNLESSLFPQADRRASHDPSPVMDHGQVRIASPPLPRGRLWVTAVCLLFSSARAASEGISVSLTHLAQFLRLGASTPSRACLLTGRISVSTWMIYYPVSLVPLWQP